MATRYLLRKADLEKTRFLAREVGIPRFVAEVLVARGITERAQVESFFEASLEREWQNPYLLSGMQEVADRLEKAIRDEEHIVVFGDFDLDGISATTVLTRALREFKAHVTPFIPLRFEEGYGLSVKAIERLKAYNPQVLVTVDCGIASKQEVPLLLESGIEVLITDHHEPLEQVPENVPVLDPKCDPSSPSAILAGVGVALKLVQALGGRFGLPYLWHEYLDFAALGTIADLMPMKGENRTLVIQGLSSINNNPRPCIQALKDACGYQDTLFDSNNVAFTLVPRLNAAGRMGQPEAALHLLLSDDYKKALNLAQHLDGLNADRRRIEAELSKCAEEQVAKDFSPDDKVIVVYGEGWHEGVKGIVASKLVNKYHVPCLLFTVDGQEARGSGRTVGDINLLAAVEKASEYLIRFGGHHAAVGVNLEARNLPAFRNALNDYMHTLPDSVFSSSVMIDSVPEISELNLRNVAVLEHLKPYGQEFLEPLFMLRNVWITDGRVVGKSRNHFSCTLTDGHASVSAIMFQCPNIEVLLENQCLVNAIFTLEIDEWMGRKSVKAMIKSLEPVFPCGALEQCLEEQERRFLDSFDEEFSDFSVLHNKAVISFEASLEKSEDNVCHSDKQEIRRRWEELLLREPQMVRPHIIHELLGSQSLHDSQEAVLDSLDEHQATLAVMATGRGKSVLFYEHAIQCALLDHAVSVFIYPLRALLADQFYHLRSLLSSFGLNAAVLCGMTPAQERERLYGEVASGQCHIILTTPEYFCIHADRFLSLQKVRFIAIDEAHHLLNAAGSGRDGYAKLGSVIRQFPHCDVLALSATVPDEAFMRIVKDLSIKDCILDATGRPNLILEDMRKVHNKLEYIAHHIADGKKSLIFVNSREACVSMTRKLRGMLSHIAPYIGFYHGGLSREKRNNIEDLFRRGVLCTLVVTSAFGEGVNIPDIHRVLLFHMPYNTIEFNQVSGRAGRNGREAVIHVLFSEQDTELNSMLLKAVMPTRDTLIGIYRTLKSMQQQANDSQALRMSATQTVRFSASGEQIAEYSSKFSTSVSLQSVITALAIFGELGLLDSYPVKVCEGIQNQAESSMSAKGIQNGIQEVSQKNTSVFSEVGQTGKEASSQVPCFRQQKERGTQISTSEIFSIRVIENPSKVDLNNSARYCEGIQELLRFNDFCDWISKCSAEDLQLRISKPLLPVTEMEGLELTVKRFGQKG